MTKFMYSLTILITLPHLPYTFYLQKDELEDVILTKTYSDNTLAHR